MLFLGHTEAKIVAVRIGHRKFSVSQGLVNWRSVKGTVRSARSIQASSLKSHIPFIDIIDKDINAPMTMIRRDAT